MQVFSAPRTRKPLRDRSSKIKGYMGILATEIAVVWGVGTFLTLVFFRLEFQYARRTGKNFVGLINPYSHWDVLIWARYFGLSLLWPFYLLAGVLAVPFVLVDFTARAAAGILEKVRRKR